MIDNHFYGAMKDDVIEFINFLKDNKLSPQWASTDSYSISYKSRRVCIIKIKENDWQLWISTQYNESFNACFCPVFRLKNPNELEIGLCKKVVLLRKSAITKGEAPKVMYVAKSKRNYYKSNQAFRKVSLLKFFSIRK